MSESHPPTSEDGQIVLTGLGLVTCLGLSPEATWQGITAGRTGIGPMPALEQRPEPDKGGAQAVDLPTGFRADLPRAARYLRFAVDQAVTDARRLESIPPDRVGVVMGTTLHGMRAGGKCLRSGEMKRLRSFLAGHVLDQALDGLPWSGPRLTTCSACSSGLGAIALAATLLRTRQIDAAICGGYDPVSEYAYAGFESLRLIASGPPQPFGADRDGMKVGEGCGIVILERSDDVMRRGAAIHAWLAGVGETSDAFHLTQPHPDGVGAAQAMRKALAAGNMCTADVNMISAHATATTNNDASEYAALASVFGPTLRTVPVMAFKSHLGHTLGAAGAVELVMTVMAMRRRRVPPTANTARIDERFTHLNLNRMAPMDHAIDATMNLSLGFGGANACVVLSRRAAQPPRTPAAPPEVPVITGIGLVLPGAVDRESFLQLLESRTTSGIDGGSIPESLYSHLLNARRARRMSEYAKLSIASAQAAIRDAGLDSAGDLSDASAILGTTHGSSPFCEAYYSQIVREGLAAANPVLFAEGVPNAAAAHLGMTFGIKGGCQTIIGTRAAGLDALILAALRIREGSCERVIVVAAEEYSSLVRDAYRACDRALDTSSGAAAFVVESRRSAVERGARIHAVIEQCGWHVAAGYEAARSSTERQKSPRAALSIDGLPELFSAGPLVSLAGTLWRPLQPGWNKIPESPGGSFSVIASEPNGTSSSIHVRFERES